MDSLDTLNSLGFTLPSPAYIFGAIVFGVIGLAGYRYGKKASLTYVKWIGIALMLYPYAISDTWMLYIVGAVLSAALYIFRNE